MTPSIGTLQGVMSGGRALGEEAWQAGRQAQNLVWWNRGPGAASGLQGGWFYRPMNHPPPTRPPPHPHHFPWSHCSALLHRGRSDGLTFSFSPSPFHRSFARVTPFAPGAFPCVSRGLTPWPPRSPPSHQLTGGLPRLPHLEQRLAAPCFSYLTQFSLGALLTPWRCTSICLIIVCLSH